MEFAICEQAQEKVDPRFLEEVGVLEEILPPSLSVTLVRAEDEGKDGYYLKYIIKIAEVWRRGDPEERFFAHLGESFWEAWRVEVVFVPSLRHLTFETVYEPLKGRVKLKPPGGRWWIELDFPLLRAQEEWARILGLLMGAARGMAEAHLRQEKGE